ncbi:MAG: hypothetical protein DRP87_04625 [Spirochaetes bacterium]|nr:MAG: hypothetical protein DRP87_04625 [Spirochaetota bacterium]
MGVKLKYILYFIILFLFLASCTVEQRATIRPNGSGTIYFHFKLEKFLYDTILEMSDLAKGNEKGGQGIIFDPEEIKKDFKENPAIILTKISSPTPGELEGEFKFDNVEAIFREKEVLKKTGAVTFIRSGDISTISLFIDRDNFKQLYTLFPVLEDPFFEMFGPLENADTSEEEYIQMVEFAFGEMGTRGLKESTIVMEIIVEGKILEQKGGTISGNSVIYKLPLIDALLLHKPIDYSIKFK